MDEDERRNISWPVCNSNGEGSGKLSRQKSGDLRCIDLDLVLPLLPDSKQANPDGKYGELFGMDTDNIAGALKHELEVNKAELITDTRWAGESWNSKQVLWEPLIRVAVAVRDKLGGPDFVPDNV